MGPRVKGQFEIKVRVKELMKAGGGGGGGSEEKTLELK